MTTSPPAQTQPPTPTTSKTSTTTAPPPAEVRASLPGFMGGPRPPAGPDPLDPAATTTVGPEELLDDDGSGFDARQPPKASGRPSTPASTSRAEPADLEVLTGALVDLGGLLAHQYLGRSGSTAWVMTPEERAMINGPAASLAARHAPAGTGDSSDLVDGLALTVGVGAFSMRSILQGRAERAEAAAVPTYVEGNGHG